MHFLELIFQSNLNHRRNIKNKISLNFESVIHTENLLGKISKTLNYNKKKFLKHLIFCYSDSCHFQTIHGIEKCVKRVEKKSFKCHSCTFENTLNYQLKIKNISSDFFVFDFFDL